MDLRCCVLVSCLLALRVVYALPEIACVTEPACNGEGIVITGEGFGTDRKSVV